MIDHKKISAMRIFLSIPLFVLLTSAGCKKEKLGSPISYFPLDEGKEWCYEASINGDGEPFAQSNWKIEGDTVIDGKTYKLMTNYGEPYKAIREEGGDFYKVKVTNLVINTKEELHFLKTTNPDGAAWEQVFDQFKYEFSQVLLPEFSFGGQTWKEVIEVKALLFTKDQNGQFKPLIDASTDESSYAMYYFAKGIGIVYMSEPSAFNQFSSFVYTVSNEMKLVDCP